MTKYIVAPDRVVWSNKHGKHFYAGEEVDLSHLPASDIAAVVQSGAVIEIVEQPTPKEVKNGKTNIN
jgi:hypothetical protein